MTSIEKLSTQDILPNALNYQDYQRKPKIYQIARQGTVSVDKDIKLTPPPNKLKTNRPINKKESPSSEL